MELVLANFLLEHAPLAALIGNRIHWDELPQGVGNPSVIMHLVSSVPSYTMQGSVDLSTARVQFDCRGASAAQARNIEAAIEDRLGGFKGIYAGVRFDGAFKQSHRSSFDKTDAVTWFTASVDYIIWSAPAA